MATTVDNALAHSVAEPIHGQSGIQTAAAGRDRVSLWKRLALSYRLFQRANDISLEVEGVSPQRQSEVARRHWGGIGEVLVLSPGKPKSQFTR